MRTFWLVEALALLGRTDERKSSSSACCRSRTGSACTRRTFSRDPPRADRQLPPDLLPRRADQRRVQAVAAGTEASWRRVRLPRRFEVQLWTSTAVLPALLVMMVVFAAIGLDLWTAGTMIVLLLCASAFIGVGNWWMLRHCANRVSIDERGIDARPFRGPSLRVDWDEVVTRDESVRATRSRASSRCSSVGGLGFHRPGGRHAGLGRALPRGP